MKYAGMGKLIMKNPLFSAFSRHQSRLFVLRQNFDVHVVSRVRRGGVPNLKALKQLKVVEVGGGAGVGWG